jgi:serine protease
MGLQAVEPALLQALRGQQQVDLHRAPQAPDGDEHLDEVRLVRQQLRELVEDDEQGGQRLSVVLARAPRLLAEPGKFQESSLKNSVLDEIERGFQVGIEDTPEQLPRAGSLVAHGWTACSTSSGSTATGVGDSPQGLSTIQHTLVSVAGTTYLVADGISHELPAENLGSVLHALGVDSEPVTEVDAAWLSLFTPGSAMQSFSVPDAGVPVTGLSSTIRNPVAGMLLSVTDDASGGQRYYVVQSDSSLGPSMTSP